uniref:Uncharacterized protein n=1 Tax=Sphaerodactylus townsendi TaxID=933632 RepID=A0ACB8G820_9SAUR
MQISSQYLSELWQSKSMKVTKTERVKASNRLLGNESPARQKEPRLAKGTGGLVATAGLAAELGTSGSGVVLPALEVPLGGLETAVPRQHVLSVVCLLVKIKCSMHIF